MEKTTPNDCPVIIPPPGVEIPTEFTKTTYVGEIKFPLNKSTDLFSPVVQAFLVDGIITVNAVVFVDSKIAKSTEFTVVQNCYVDIEGDPQLQFFVCYNLDDKDAAKNFWVYEVNFQVQPIMPFDILKIESIQTFLWDVDPIGSRGTVTIVQQGT
ncbi:hypothetical protein AAEO57_14400 [Flavobacterium sp. DGU38]|uniref:Uncharacterized protein n=1 Tax=Flavobacterium calami TaxID=3139144 RepID=A0ABU9ITK3_9FLAO